MMGNERKNNCISCIKWKTRHSCFQHGKNIIYQFIYFSCGYNQFLKVAKLSRLQTFSHLLCYFSCFLKKFPAII